jgi:hypothetical protein
VSLPYVHHRWGSAIISSPIQHSSLTFTPQSLRDRLWRQLNCRGSTIRLPTVLGLATHLDNNTRSLHRTPPPRLCSHSREDSHVFFGRAITWRRIPSDPGGIFCFHFFGSLPLFLVLFVLLFSASSLMVSTSPLTEHFDQSWTSVCSRHSVAHDHKLYIA